MCFNWGILYCFLFDGTRDQTKALGNARQALHHSAVLILVTFYFKIKSKLPRLASTSLFVWGFVLFCFVLVWFGFGFSRQGFSV
jgi:membrane-associated PAP2 superfamily phosphatase